MSHVTSPQTSPCCRVNFRGLGSYLWIRNVPIFSLECSSWSVSNPLFDTAIGNNPACNMYAIIVFLNRNLGIFVCILDRNLISTLSVLGGAHNDSIPPCTSLYGFFTGWVNMCRKMYTVYSRTLFKRAVIGTHQSCLLWEQVVLMKDAIHGKINWFSAKLALMMGCPPERGGC